MKLITSLTMALVAALSISAHAAETNKPFARGALTQYQLDAWSNYLAEESSLYGCSYGDDPRLTEDPQGTLEALYQQEDIKPVQVTYRTLLNMGPSTREIISNNIVIASMECNTVYYDGKALIGTPVIPFEEAITILHDDYALYQDENRIHQLKDTFLVAGMDPRWFWAYFIADKAHMDMIGLDYDTLVKIDTIVNEREQPLNYKDDSYQLPYFIHEGLHHRPIAYYSMSGKCTESHAEPSKKLTVWPGITDEIVQKFYHENRVRYEDEWDTKVDKDNGGLTLFQEEPISDKNFPAFTVTRGMSIHSNACEQNSRQPDVISTTINNNALNF